MQIKRDLKILGIAFLILSVISVVRQFWINIGERQLSPLESAVIFLFYIILLNIWWNSISRRIAQRSVRKYLVISHWVIVGWIIVRLGQSCITAEVEKYGRFSGYLVGVPVAYVLLMNFYASLMLGKPADEHIKKRWYLLLIPASLIAFGLMTNDYHQFFAKEVPVESGPSNIYETNVGFVFIAVWVIVLELAKIANIFRSGRMIQDKKLRWLPIIELVMVILYSVPYVMIGFAPPRVEFIEYTIGVIFYEILVWETCILIGVLPVNSRYREVFHCADIGMQILNNDGTVFEQSQDADSVQPQQFEELKDKQVISLENGLELHMAQIGGGYVTWHTDTRALHGMIEELEEKQEELTDEDFLLRTELSNKQELQRIRERRRLYELIYKETEDDRKEILNIVGQIRGLMRENDESDKTGTEEEIRELLARGCNLALSIKTVGNKLLEEEYSEEADYE